MRLIDEFPLIYCLNLAKRQDRRARCEQLFEDAGLAVRRYPAVDATYVKRMRGFAAPGRYAHAVSTRGIIRRAIQRKAPAVFIFEDDVVLAPDLHERLVEIELPDDWGMFYLGCQHHERPEVVAPGLIRVRGALDTHAWGIRSTHYRQVMRALEGKEDPTVGSLPAADVLLTRLQRKVPTYAVFPNLAWQEEAHSDLLNGVYSNYREDGTQITASNVVRGLSAESLGGSSWSGCLENISPPFYLGRFSGEKPVEAVSRNPPSIPAPPVLAKGQKVAFLFVTINEHAHADVWSDYWSGKEDRVSIYCHAKERDSLEESWVRNRQIAEHIDAKWADVTVLRAQLALLKAALADSENAFFAFASESCLPVKPLSDLLCLLERDGRSRFGFDTYEDCEERHLQKRQRAQSARRIPASYFVFHSQWVFLNRKAAELITEDDFTAHFETVFSPDEAYFGTVLNLKGFPLEGETIARRDMTWTSWEEKNSPHPEAFDSIDSRIAGDLMTSGAFFARKFAKGCLPEWISSKGNTADRDGYRNP